MTTIHQEDQINARDSEGTFSLTTAAAGIWHARYLFASITLAIFLVGLLFASGLTKYKSEGFFQFGGAIPLPAPRTAKEKEKDPGNGITLADYKRYSAAFFAAGRFEDFVQEKKLTGIDGIENLRASFRSAVGINKMIEPIYPYTKLDAKDLMEQPKDSSNNVIGLKINYEAKSPQTAQQMVDLLGRYTIDSIVYLIYSDSLRFKHADLTGKLTTLDNDIIDLEQKLVDYQRKGINLKQIVARYPSAVNEAGRQVVSVTDETARFLSPMTHLMSTEVEALEASELILKAKRRQQILRLQLEYSDEAGKLINSTKSGEAILRQLEPLKERVFKAKDLKNEIVKEVYNGISIENNNATTLYFKKSRFIAGPTLPQNKSINLLTAGLISLIAGLILAVIAVFSREWWIKNWPELKG